VREATTAGVAVNALPTISNVNTPSSNAATGITVIAARRWTRKSPPGPAPGHQTEGHAQGHGNEQDGARLPGHDRSHLALRQPQYLQDSELGRRWRMPLRTVAAREMSIAAARATARVRGWLPIWVSFATAAPSTRSTW
jgi:hypothetical protein